MYLITAACRDLLIQGLMPACWWVSPGAKFSASILVGKIRSWGLCLWDLEFLELKLSCWWVITGLGVLELVPKSWWMMMDSRSNNDPLVGGGHSWVLWWVSPILERLGEDLTEADLLVSRPVFLLS